jgi:hypothetical protein
MKSPFPGMDPYLEPHWLDIHTKLVAYAADDLNERLPDDLIASTEERVAVESESGEEHVFGPDVRVFEGPADEPHMIDQPPGGAVAAPFRLLAQVEPIIERFIRIIEARTERLITVIEFISPTNKRSEGVFRFKSKRAELLASGVNFIEIDLVRAGDWRALLRPHRCGTKAFSTYRVTSRVPNDPGAVYLQPISLREPMPSVPIPLRSRDPEIRIDLQSLVDRAYSNGRYEKRLDYRQPLDPPLAGDDAVWADQLLKSAGKR